MAETPPKPIQSNGHPSNPRVQQLSSLTFSILHHPPSPLPTCHPWLFDFSSTVKKAANSTPNSSIRSSPFQNHHSRLQFEFCKQFVGGQAISSCIKWSKQLNEFIGFFLQFEFATSISSPNLNFLLHFHSLTQSIIHSKKKRRNQMESEKVKNVHSKQELEKMVSEGNPVILHFWASWCDASKHMDQVFSHLSTDFPHAHFFRVEAEEQPEISEAYSVSAVPYFVFFKGGKPVDSLEGADPSSLANKVAKVAGSVNPDEPSAPASLGLAAGSTIIETVKELSKDNRISPLGNQSGRSEDLNKKLQQLINSHPVMLFMKGSPEEPKCGFSQKVVNTLKEENVIFGSFDILTDQEVREGLKKFSNWPTYPQLYCKGELIGGCDIVISMHEGGELKDVFRDHEVETTYSSGGKLPEPASGKGGISASTGLSSSVTSRLVSLINSSPVMLFMKGTPEEPKCGFSRKVLEILQQEKVQFETFDILTDNEVRQGLKVYSNWSSYPQLYIKGELIGGSDVVLEMQKSGELRRVLAEKGVIIPDESYDERLTKLVNSSPVMLFMKGNPDAPKCGFSSKVVNALKEEGVTFGSFDILSDDEVRQGLKKFLIGLLILSFTSKGS